MIHKLIFCSLLVGLSAKSFAQDISILLIGSKPDHPYATHMYEFECKLLAKCLEKNEGVRAEYVAAWPPTNAQLASAAAIVFYSSPAGSVLLMDQHRDRFDQLMKGDVGFVAIHWGTGVGYDKVSEPESHRDQFKGWLGGWFRRPPCGIKIDRAELQLVDQQHEIGRGWDEWKIHDEFYLNPVLHDQAQPLLEVVVEGERNVVGWTLQRPGSGRSVGITLGHFHHNFARDDFRKLIVNSILWSARVEVPAHGAIVKVEPGEVELPKEAKSR